MEELKIMKNLILFYLAIFFHFDAYFFFFISSFLFPFDFISWMKESLIFY